MWSCEHRLASLLQLRNVENNLVEVISDRGDVGLQDVLFNGKQAVMEVIKQSPIERWQLQIEAARLGISPTVLSLCEYQADVTSFPCVSFENVNTDKTAAMIMEPFGGAKVIGYLRVVGRNAVRPVAKAVKEGLSTLGKLGRHLAILDPSTLEHVYVDANGESALKVHFSDLGKPKDENVEVDVDDIIRVFEMITNDETFTWDLSNAWVRIYKDFVPDQEFSLNLIPRWLPESQTSKWPYLPAKFWGFSTQRYSARDAWEMWKTTKLVFSPQDEYDINANPKDIVKTILDAKGWTNMELRQMLHGPHYMTASYDATHRRWKQITEYQAQDDDTKLFNSILSSDPDTVRKKNPERTFDIQPSLDHSATIHVLSDSGFKRYIVVSVFLFYLESEPDECADIEPKTVWENVVGPATCNLVWGPEVKACRWNHFARRCQKSAAFEKEIKNRVHHKVDDNGPRTCPPSGAPYHVSLKQAPNTLTSTQTYECNISDLSSDKTTSPNPLLEKHETLNVYTAPVGTYVEKDDVVMTYTTATNNVSVSAEESGTVADVSEVNETLTVTVESKSTYYCSDIGRNVTSDVVQVLTHFITLSFWPPGVLVVNLPSICSAIRNFDLRSLVTVPLTTIFTVSLSNAITLCCTNLLGSNPPSLGHLYHSFETLSDKGGGMIAVAAEAGTEEYFMRTHFERIVRKVFGDADQLERVSPNTFRSSGDRPEKSESALKEKMRAFFVDVEQPLRKSLKRIYSSTSATFKSLNHSVRRLKVMLFTNLSFGILHLMNYPILGSEVVCQAVNAFFLGMIYSAIIELKLVMSRGSTFVAHMLHDLIGFVALNEMVYNMSFMRPMDMLPM